MIYEIAGLKVEMEPKFCRLLRQSEAYRSSGEPVFGIKPDFDGVAGAVSDTCTEEEREYICSSAVFCREIIRHGRFFLHASAVVYEGEAYLFSAPSGVGKSTHTALWLKNFQGSYILNDDKPVIFPEKEHIFVWGTPFSGKTDLQVNRCVPLRAICFLQQGNENSIRRIAEDRAIALTLNNTYRPGDSQGMRLLLDLVGQTVAGTDIFEMSCRRECEAAEMSYRAMKGQ